jgi:chromate transport protein ChrA
MSKTAKSFNVKALDMPARFMYLILAPAVLLLSLAAAVKTSGWVPVLVSALALVGVAMVLRVWVRRSDKVARRYIKGALIPVAVLAVAAGSINARLGGVIFGVFWIMSLSLALENKKPGDRKTYLRTPQEDTSDHRSL